MANVNFRNFIPNTNTGLDPSKPDNGNVMHYHKELARLKEINQHLDSKIRRLVNMLGGDNSELVQREKICDAREKKIYEAIDKLCRAKKELIILVQESHQRIEELEEENVLLKKKYSKLEQEYNKIKEELEQYKRSQYIRVKQEDHLQEASYKNDNETDRYPKKMPTREIQQKELSLQDIAKQLQELSSRFSRIEESLNKNVPEPYISEHYTNSIDKFLQEET